MATYNSLPVEDAGEGQQDHWLPNSQPGEQVGHEGFLEIKEADAVPKAGLNRPRGDSDIFDPWWQPGWLCWDPNDPKIPIFQRTPVWFSGFLGLPGHPTQPQQP